MVISSLFVEDDKELNWKVGGMMLILYWKGLLSFILSLCFIDCGSLKNFIYASEGRCHSLI